MKTLIKNGLIHDGTGKKPYKGDILIEDGRIIAIRPVDFDDNSNSIIHTNNEGYAINNESPLGTNNEEWTADIVFYADHKAVTPGFID